MLGICWIRIVIGPRIVAIVDLIVEPDGAIEGIAFRELELLSTGALVAFSNPSKSMARAAERGAVQPLLAAGGPLAPASAARERTARRCVGSTNGCGTS